MLTCTGSLSRNHAVGLQLGRGRRLEDILNETVTVAEGVRTTKAATALARQFQVEMPIVQGVHAMLFENKPPKQIVADLMSRSAKEETLFANSDHSPLTSSPPCTPRFSNLSCGRFKPDRRSIANALEQLRHPSL